VLTALINETIRCMFQRAHADVFLHRLESRILLSAAALDQSYHPAFQEALMEASYAFAPKVEIQIDNKALHSAPNADASRWLLWRTLPSGKLDRSFARKGIFRQSAAIVDFAVDTLGRVILVANDSGHVRVSRLTQNGITDPTFGDDGQTIVYEPYVSSVALQNDDKIVVSTNNYQFGMLIRFNSDGS